MKYYIGSYSKDMIRFWPKERHLADSVNISDGISFTSRKKAEEYLYLKIGDHEYNVSKVFSHDEILIANIIK